MTEPMKTVGEIRNSDSHKWLIKEGYLNPTLFALKEHGESRVSELLERYAAQQVAAERGRIKKTLKNKILRDGKISSMTTIDELIDSL